MVIVDNLEEQLVCPEEDKCLLSTVALPGAVVPVTVEFSPRPSKCPPQSLGVGAALREVLPALQNNPSTYHSQLCDEGSILQDF